MLLAVRDNSTRITLQYDVIMGSHELGYFVLSYVMMISLLSNIVQAKL